MFYEKQCAGCAWNTGRFPVGCEAYTELPAFCSNYITQKERDEVEKEIESYNSNNKMAYFKNRYGRWALGKKCLTTG